MVGMLRKRGFVRESDGNFWRCGHCDLNSTNVMLLLFGSTPQPSRPRSRFASTQCRRAARNVGMFDSSLYQTTQRPPLRAWRAAQISIEHGRSARRHARDPASRTHLTAVDRALWYIESHFGAPLVLDEVAECAGVSRFHLFARLQRSDGWSIMRYVRARRLTASARRLGAAPESVRAQEDPQIRTKVRLVPRCAAR
jgi:AraC-like DNA-binding protein